MKKDTIMKINICLKTQLRVLKTITDNNKKKLEGGFYLKVINSLLTI